MRMLGLIAVLALLGGCNVVHSSQPMFTAADVVGAPSFREGVWASPDPHCDFDPNKPVETWPSCANGAPAGFGLKPGEELLVVAGEPLIVQYRDVNDVHEAEYFFAGLAPISRDRAGRITAAQFWSIQCGPPPRGGKSHSSKRRPTRSGTLHPLPGMVMDADATNCTAQSAAAIRAAALPSRAWSKPAQTSYWVRDGDH